MFSHYPRVSPGNHPLTKMPEDSEYEIGYEKIITDRVHYLSVVQLAVVE